MGRTMPRDACTGNRMRGVPRSGLMCGKREAPRSIGERYQLGRKLLLATLRARTHVLVRKGTHMYQSPSHLPPEARAQIAAALNARLADGLDLHSQIKVAHWNIKGPQF